MKKLCVLVFAVLLVPATANVGATPTTIVAPVVGAMSVAPPAFTLNSNMADACEAEYKRLTRQCDIDFESCIVFTFGSSWCDFYHGLCIGQAKLTREWCEWWPEVVEKMKHGDEQ